MVLNGKGRSGSDMRLERVPYDEGEAPSPFAPDPPAEWGKERTEYQGGASRRSWPRHRQQHDVDVVVLNEGGYVGPPPGSADGSCTEEADKEDVFGRGRTKGNVKLNVVVYALYATMQFYIDSIFQKNRPKQFSVDRIERFLKVYKSNIQFAVQGNLFLYQG